VPELHPVTIRIACVASRSVAGFFSPTVTTEFFLNCIQVARPASGSINLPIKCVHCGELLRVRVMSRRRKIFLRTSLFAISIGLLVTAAMIGRVEAVNGSKEIGVAALIIGLVAAVVGFVLLLVIWALHGIRVRSGFRLRLLKHGITSVDE
jgi:hypothetical protein